MTSDWVVLQLSEGIAYAFERKGSKELPLGGVIVCPPKSEITITASVLGQAVFRGMAIRVNSLTGFLTAPERQCLETEVARQLAPFLTLPAEHALAKRVGQIFAQDQKPTFSNRLAYAHTFAELVAPQLYEALNKGLENDKNQQETKGRLRMLISELPESELSTLSLGEMAKMLHCCERHASRLFREECGTGFLSYVSDIRLKKACDLLLQSNLKIIDVALESGHGSLAHFNFVFKKRFHMTPTEWRERKTSPPRRVARARPTRLAAVAVSLMLSVVGISSIRGAPGPAGASGNKPAAATATGANTAPAPATLKFKVDRYEVRGNTLLSSNLISRILAPYTGDAVDISKVTNAMATLQLEYFQRGYVTVKVTAPPQQVTNRVVFFQATEGRLAAVKILHNRYYSSNNIMAALPYVKSLESGDRILNAKVFQTELDRANSNPDRQISPEVRPGLDPGTTALILDVKDRVPLHGRLEWDNYSPPGTPELRLNANASYANLWQLDHTLGVQYGFSPNLMKPSTGDDTHLSLNPLDSPDVTYYSGFYRAPLGPPEAVENQIAQDPNHFGYNETTKQFVLPPNTGRPEFTAYVSRSTTGPTIYGPEANVVGGGGGTNQLLTIDKQLVSQQYTSQTTAGGRLSFPLPTWQEIQSSWSIGMDYKSDKVVTLPTNYFYYTTRIKQGNYAGAPVTTTESTIGIAGTATYPSLNYTPLFLGWNGSRQDHWGQRGPPGDQWSEFDGSISVVAGTGGTFTPNRAFPALIANSSEATTEFVAIRPQLSRTQVLPDNFTLYGNMAGQWANVPLLNLEQLALGGNASVRGYREGELYADTGWLGQLELRSPVYWRGANRRVGTQLTLFMDYGEGFTLDSNAHQSLWGGGAGVNFNLGPYVESHILVAWPLLNSAYTIAGHPRISFSLSAQL
ncbi:MAG TPA: ShlB/FhaC/HecB family hemolysin secretion/activation protein [Candidatus Baltobacteraceae bacterium]|nr:ShlB/FhaC/HecB family hemolysin secretion/activation protein [Candidatus Baltobacteraceae bacterium]